MRAELVLLGKRFDMAPRARRRALVIAIYVALGIFIATLWYTTHLRGLGSYIIFAAIFACRSFLGGYYRGGLVKPFQYYAPRNAQMPPPLLALKLHLYKPVLQADEGGFRNDEREIHQRDHAHYLAYQAVSVVISMIVFIALLRMSRLNLIPVQIAPDELYYGLGLIAIVLLVTLPQVILLWTEPDMEPPADFAEEG